MIPQGITEACVKVFYGCHDDTTYGKIQDVLMAYESMKSTLGQQCAATRPADVGLDRYNAIRNASSRLQIYVYDDPADDCSGEWMYKPHPENVDAFCDALIAEAQPSQGNRSDTRPAEVGGDGWLPIQSAPTDEVHVRGVWVTCSRGGSPETTEWRMYVGHINDRGDFVDPEHNEDFGWCADEYEAWHALTPPAPGSEVRP